MGVIVSLRHGIDGYSSELDKIQGRPVSVGVLRTIILDTHTASQCYSVRPFLLRRVLGSRIAVFHEKSTQFVSGTTDVALSTAECMQGHRSSVANRTWTLIYAMSHNIFIPLRRACYSPRSILVHCITTTTTSTLGIRPSSLLHDCPQKCTHTCPRTRG